jgi:hypothetical protein
MFFLFFGRKAKNNARTGSLASKSLVEIHDEDLGFSLEDLTPETKSEIVKRLITSRERKMIQMERTRRNIVNLLLTFFICIVIFSFILFSFAIFTGKSTDAVSNFVLTVLTPLTNLVSLIMGYYIGQNR